MNNRRDAGLTWVEFLVYLGIFWVLLCLCVAIVGTGFGRGRVYRTGNMTQTLSNMKQLLLATQTMVIDGETSGGKNLGWPGDTGGTFTNWAKQLVPTYLGTNDFCKLLSAPGVTVPQTKLPTEMSKGALVVYAVRSDSPPETVFLTTANFTNSPQGGSPLPETKKPYANKSFVVFRKGGDGAILMKNQVGKTNLIGAYAPPLK